MKKTIAFISTLVFFAALSFGNGSKENATQKYSGENGSIMADVFWDQILFYLNH